MTYIATPPTAVKPKSGDTPGERDLTLSALRVASAEARLVAHQIETVAASLRQKAIDCETALRWMKDEGLLRWVKLGPGVKLHE